MSARLLLAGFAKSVLAHRHAFVPSLAATLAIGRAARLPASFDEAYGAPAPRALDAALRRGRWGEAAAHARAWARREPARPEPLIVLGVLRLWARPGARLRPGPLESLVDRYAAPEGVALLEKAVRAAPDWAPARLWLALALLRRVSLPECWKQLDALCARRPAWSWGFLVRSELGRVDIVYDKALADLAAAERLEPENGWVHAFRARVLFQSAPGPAAMAAMDRAVSLAPAAGWVRAWRADARRKSGDLAGARSDLEAALALEPYDRAWLWLGKVLRAQGDPKGAERALTTGLRACPHFEKALAERARARLELGRTEAALADLEAAVRLNHRHNSLWCWTAEVEPLTPERHRTLSRLKDHAAARPRSARAWAWLGEALTQAGLPAEGLVALDRARSLSPRRPWLSTWRGEALLRLGRLAEAEEELDAAVRRDPHDGRARAFRGRVRFLRGRAQAAVSDLELACSDSMVEYSWVYHWRAQAKRAAGDLAGARRDQATAVQLDPGLASRGWVAGVRADTRHVHGLCTCRVGGRQMSVLAELCRRDEEILEALPARLGWPFIAEHDLWFHGRLHGPRLRALLARVEKASDAKSLAAAGRLRRLLGDDAGAARDLKAALDRDPSLAAARAWLAELDLAGAHAEEGLSAALAAPQALLYRAASRLMRGDARGALADARAHARRRPRSALAALLEGEALWRLKRPSARAFARACRLEPVCAAGWLLRARSEAGGLPAVLPPRAARWVDAAHDADPTYALITLSWHGPRAEAGAAWRRHLGRLLRFAFAEPERAGWYYRQDDIHYAPYHFQEYADARALLAIRPRSAWAEALTARGALRCPPDPELARQGLVHARRAARLAPWAGWTRAWVGLGLIKARRGAEAERHFTECLRLQPLYHRALAWRGSLRRNLGKTEEALSDLDRAIAVDELYPFAPHERSLARRLAGDWVGAALDLDRAFRLDWRYCWVFASGRAPGDDELARGEAELDRALRAHPSCVSLRTWRGELRRARGDLSGALADLLDAAAQDPAHAPAQAFLGRTLLEAGRAAEAVPPLERAAALMPTLFIFRGWLAEALFRAGRRNEAFARVSEIVRGTPQHWWALHLRAGFELELGRPARALRDIRLADSYEGRHADGHHLAARACLALGRLAEAEEEADKALRVSPHLGRALLLRAEVRRLRGRTEESLADWRSVLERFPYLLNEEERARARALLAP